MAAVAEVEAAEGEEAAVAVAGAEAVAEAVVAVAVAVEVEVDGGGGGGGGGGGVQCLLHLLAGRSSIESTTTRPALNFARRTATLNLLPARRVR